MSKQQEALPRHVAIIMDGNGRWAKKNAMSVMMGHRQGVETLRNIVRHSSNIGLAVLSLYAFSTENWKRSKAEVSALMGLIQEFFTSEIDELVEQQVHIRILGEKDGLTPGARQAVYLAEDRTRQNTGMTLNIALNYGARDEILRSARLLAKDAAQGRLDPDRIQATDFERYLYTHDQPDVDLLIRTSGEMRLSNFLLYQCAYAEFVFPDLLWPEFTLEAYQAALNHYMLRDRRFGGRET